jgi:hypothetical protein
MRYGLLASVFLTAAIPAAYAQSIPQEGGRQEGQPPSNAEATPPGPLNAPGRPITTPSTVPSVTACRPMMVPFGTRGTIEANINVSTRLQFPATVTRVTVSTPNLWDSTFAEHSAWVRPKTNLAPAGQTGLTVFLANGRTYDFLVNASAVVPPSCVLIVEPVQPQAQQAPTAPQPPQRTPEEIAAAQAAAAARTRAAAAAAFQRRTTEDARLTDRFTAMRRQVEQQATDRIKQFQHSIDTNYRWTGSSRADERLVNAVYDDGRFTYVRIVTDAFGVPALTGRVNGKDTLLQYTYDDLTGVFTVQGLYDRLSLSIGTHALDIRRRG